MLDVGLLVFSLGIILLSAELFTNGVEWLGKVLRLSEGAIGSLLAAVGTALPETLVPIIAIGFGHDAAATEIGIGAILGAPFMLGTLALFVTGLAVIIFTLMGKRRLSMRLDEQVLARDMRFFLIVYSAAILASLLQFHGFKLIIAILLMLAYAYYAYKTITCGEISADSELSPLLIARKNPQPSFTMIIFQVAIALAGIILGAELFVHAIEKLSFKLGISAFVLSIIITPIATELPEKFNSVIWVSRGKDTLALGNITGAMVFQSSIIPAIGIAMTNWTLTPTAFISAIMVIMSVALIYLIVNKTRRLRGYTLLTGGIFYAAFLLLVLGKKFI